jgi:hypothetical protein
MSAKKSRRALRSNPARAPKPKVPEVLRRRVQAEADALVEQVLKPRYLEPPPPEPRFNYIIDVFTRWWGSYFYFCATYACPGSNALSPSFEVRFARLEYAGGERFHMAFMRYTGEWIEIYEGVPWQAALTAIRDDSYFRLD